MKHMLFVVFLSRTFGILRRENASAVIVLQEPVMVKEKTVLANLSNSSLGVEIRYLSSNGEVNDVLRFLSLYHHVHLNTSPIIAYVNSFQERLLHEAANCERKEYFIYRPSSCHKVQYVCLFKSRPMGGREPIFSSCVVGSFERCNFDRLWNFR